MKVHRIIRKDETSDPIGSWFRPNGFFNRANNGFTKRDANDGRFECERYDEKS